MESWEKPGVRVLQSLKVLVKLARAVHLLGLSAVGLGIVLCYLAMDSVLEI